MFICQDCALLRACIYMYVCIMLINVNIMSWNFWILFFCLSVSYVLSAVGFISGILLIRVCNCTVYLLVGLYCCLTKEENIFESLSSDKVFCNVLAVWFIMGKGCFLLFCVFVCVCDTDGVDRWLLLGTKNFVAALTHGKNAYTNRKIPPPSFPIFYVCWW